VTRAVATAVAVAALALAGCGGDDGGGGGGGSSSSSLTPESVRDFTVRYLEDPANKAKVPVTECPDPELQREDDDGFEATVVSCASFENGATLVTYAVFPDAAAVRDHGLANTSYALLVDGNVAVWTSNKYFEGEEDGGDAFLEALKADCGCGEFQFAES
jgi:hypothetical protein